MMDTVEGQGHDNQIISLIFRFCTIFVHLLIWDTLELHPFVGMRLL